MKFTKKISQHKERFEKLPDKFLLKGGRIVDPAQGVDKETDLLIVDGTIEKIGSVDTANFDGEVQDIKGKLITPGWMDMHVHLREPGREDEETLETGSLSAANGGFTAVCCMPNTRPAIDSQEMIRYVSDRGEKFPVDIRPIAAVTKEREGKELSEMLELWEAGAVAFSDDGRVVASPEIMRRALEYSKMVGLPVIGYAADPVLVNGGQMNEGYVSTCLGLKGIPSVAEDMMVARDIMLAEYTGGHYHVAHITTARSVDLVRQAKSRGVRVTAEATPHHFTLTDEDVRSFDTNTKIAPPLRTEADRQAIIEGLADGTIDVITSDHSPHAWEEKAAEYIYAPFGIIGLETMMGLSFNQLYHKKILTLEQLIEKFAVNPFRVLGLTPPSVKTGELANLTLFDPTEEWTLKEKNILSRSKNTPFIGETFTGKPFAVINHKQRFISRL